MSTARSVEGGFDMSRKREKQQATAEKMRPKILDAHEVYMRAFDAWRTATDERLPLQLTDSFGATGRKAHADYILLCEDRLADATELLLGVVRDQRRGSEEWYERRILDYDDQLEEWYAPPSQS